MLIVQYYMEGVQYGGLTEPAEVTWMQAPQPHFWGLPETDTELEKPSAATCQ